jgi:hypothetical protein
MVITDPLPQELAGRFDQLVAVLDDAIPAKQLDRNLLPQPGTSAPSAI